jgi:hypothetical protein
MVADWFDRPRPPKATLAVSEAPMIGAQMLGNCHYCRKPLFETTTACPHGRGRGYPTASDMPGLPPCPVLDGTLRKAIDAARDARVKPEHDVAGRAA